MQLSSRPTSGQAENVKNKSRIVFNELLLTSCDMNFIHLIYTFLNSLRESVSEYIRFIGVILDIERVIMETDEFFRRFGPEVTCY